VEKTTSKEVETGYIKYIATDFLIFYSRNHDYADGNQITSFTTSIVKDAYDNTVSDGTMVIFHITYQKTICFKTFGSTINGIATRTKTSSRSFG
jgi:hypothetical protein